MKQPERWSRERAQSWWDGTPWPVGFNYVTSNAVNDVEMWMQDTFDLPLIRRELTLARSLGFCSLRVFLSYTVWQREQHLFLQRFDAFLDAAAGCGLTVMPVLFDDCAFDFGADPVYGRQPEPVYGVHNSRWVPSPGFSVQDDPVRLEDCRRYVDAVVGAHREDRRILAWDVYNEPGNSQRRERCLPLLTGAFRWARAWEPIQPLTAGVFDFTPEMAEVSRVCLESSDVISLHSYTPLPETEERLTMAEGYGRPVLVTEWLHRPIGNGYREHLPLFREKKIGIWQWGLIVGKTQTHLSWDTMGSGRPDPAPDVWQHDLILPDGTPFDPEELALLRQYTDRVGAR